VILAGRRINDGMGKYIAEQTVKQMISAGNMIRGAKVTVLGLTFKEDCADLRNSKVVDIIRELQAYGVEVAVHDPEADPAEALHEYGVRLQGWESLPVADAIVAAVAHKGFIGLPAEALQAKLVAGGVFVDVKATFPLEGLRALGFKVWRL
jgi:UDP-N-acetyl-D-galactosamine dehydrogenase